MTVKEAALTLRMHEDTIRRRIRRGQILAWGRPQRIRIEDLLPVYVPSGTQKSR
jgi:excisionase family DNA binding protein